MPRSTQLSISPFSARLPRLFCAALIAAVVVSLFAIMSHKVVRADDDDDDDAPPANQPQVARQVIMLSPENFDQWVFGGGGNNATQVLKQFDALVDLRLEALDRACTLSDVQKKKLRLAAFGDIKKFRDQYEQLKQKYQNTQQDPNNLNDVFVAIQPLQLQWRAGILGDQSLFQKVIDNTLQAQQKVEYDQEETARNHARYQAKIKLAVTTLDGTLSFTAAQRQQFETLLQQTTPPKNFGQYDFYYVMYQASQLPDEKLKSIFDARQMKILLQVFQRYKGYELMLKQQGML
jgi:hypothetical protein